MSSSCGRSRRADERTWFCELLVIFVCFLCFFYGTFLGFFIGFFVFFSGVFLFLAFLRAFW